MFKSVAGAKGIISELTRIHARGKRSDWRGQASLDTSAKYVVTIERSIRNILQHAIEHPGRKPESQDGGNDDPHSADTHILEYRSRDKISLPTY